RGHGRSSQPWDGNNLDTYADDLAELIEALDLRDVILVGHSTGGGEITRYIGRHGNERVAKAVLVGAIPPLMLKTAANPGGTPIEAFDAIRAGVLGDRSQFYADLAVPFYGANRDGSNVSDGVLREFWRLGMMAGLKGAYDCIKAFSETDLTEDLKRIDVPTLIVHGNDDQIVPIDDSAMLAAKLVPDAELKVYPGAPHGLMTTHRDQFNADKRKKSACHGQCASYWPPLIARQPTAGAGLKASLLGTTTRRSGKLQVTYDGHPLYFFAEDKKAGDVNGQGFVHFGGAW